MGFKSLSSSFMIASGLLSLAAVHVEAQPANPANREYGRTSLIRKTNVANPANSTPSNSAPVREYGTQSLIKANANSNDSDYQTYVDGLEKKISSVQGPKKFLGQVIVNFTINKNGTISNAKVAKSSNMPQIDTAALAAAQTAGPFGVMPKSRTKPIIVEVTFDGTSSSTTTHALVKNP
jgi:TonB family protein